MTMAILTEMKHEILSSKNAITENHKNKIKKDL